MQPDNKGTTTPNANTGSGVAPKTNPVTAPNQIDVNAVNARTEAEREDTPDPTHDVISQRLQQESVQVAEEDRHKPEAHQPMMIDLAKMSMEQLQQLKSMLNVTPDRVQKKMGNIRVIIREVEVGGIKRYVTDFKDAQIAIDYETNTGREIESHRIPVRLDGDKEYIQMHYSQFMQSNRVPVEVISQRTVDNSVSEGEVLQRETGKIVEKEIKIVTYFYTVKLPNGKEVEINGKISNS